MVELKKYIPKSVIESIKSINDEDILAETKKKYLKQIKGRRGGTTYLKLCAKRETLTEESIIEHLATSFNLSKIYYITVNFFTCTHSHFILNCKKFNPNTIMQNLKRLENANGQPIWGEDVKKKPILWNIFQEYDNKHYYITYLHSNPKNTFFDPIIHEFKEYRPTGIINFRVHLDHSLFIEVFTKNTTNNHIKKSISHIEKILDISEVNFMEITQDNMENFDRTVKRVSHEAREGEETTLYLTRVNKDKDTRNDVIRVDFGLEDREFRKEHGIIEVNKNDYNIGLIRGKKGRVQIMRHLPPQEQVDVMHEVFKILGWTI